jgi:pyruvate/2-oxoglutarate dehydrogenase complex dihydrolipoamide dehydrogenase (E3) component
MPPDPPFKPTLLLDAAMIRSPCAGGFTSAGIVKIYVREGTDKILGATIVGLIQT